MTFDPSTAWSLREELQELIFRIEQVPFWPPDDSDAGSCSEAGQYPSDSSDSEPGPSLRSSDTETGPPSPTMNSTKRKFNALLNSIGSSSTDDLRTSKLPRTSSLPRSTTTPLDLASPRTAAVAHMSKTELRFAISRPGEAGAKPTFLPGDREDFLARLATFRNLTDWMPKPPKVNEVAWAKRGWACQRLERVRCVTCSVEILVKLNKQEDDEGKVVKFAGMESDIEQALVDKYASLIITSHDSLCPWRKRGCDDSIFKQPLYPLPTTYQSLKTRYDSLLPLAALLPAESIFKLPVDYNLDAIIPHLPSPFSAATLLATDAAQPEPLNRVALLLALFGFSARPAHVPKLGAADCRVCFRTLGLWLYRPKISKGVADGEETVLRESAMKELDPLECHKEYCPWVNGESQNPGGKDGKKAIWELLGEAIGREDVRGGAGGEKEVSVAAEEVVVVDGDGEGEVRDEGEYEKLRDEKDKERWARLRKVKSLFEGKSKRLSKTKH